MEAVYGLNEDLMQIDVAVSRKRKRDDDTDEEVKTDRVVRARLNSKKRGRDQETDDEERVVRSRFFMQQQSPLPTSSTYSFKPQLPEGKRSREEQPSFERNTRQKVDENPQTIQPSPYERRVDMMLLHLQGAIDALHRGLMDQNRINHIVQIVDDVLWLQKECFVSPERFNQLTPLLCFLCMKDAMIMQCIGEKVTYLHSLLNDRI